MMDGWMDGKRDVIQASLSLTASPESVVKLCQDHEADPCLCLMGQ